MGIYDVPAGYLIEEVSAKIKEEGLAEPSFTGYVKSGRHNERAPQREDWFYIRMASILYRAYKWNVIGTERLRSYYGGKRNRGLKREHQYKASGKIIRSAVQELEKTGYLAKAKPKGRKLTPKGQKLLNEMSKIVAKGITENKYAKKEKIKKKEDKGAKEVHDELKKQKDAENKKAKDIENKKKEKQKKPKKAEGDE